MFQTLDLYQESTEPKDHLQSLLESTATAFLCRLQDTDCLSNIKRLYQKIPVEYFNNPLDVANP